jgi:hypothetical protein
MEPTRIWLRAQEWVVLRAGGRGERGDVPGWVLVSVMTITVGMGLFAVARPMLTDMLRTALDSVR